MNYAKRVAQYLAAGMTLAAAQAQAAVDAAVTTAISTASADAAILGGLVLAVMVGIAAFKWLRRTV